MLGAWGLVELAMLIAAVVLMVRVASMEGRSAVLWGVLTLVLCIGSAAIPLPMIRIVIAVVVSYGIMFALKLMDK